MASSSLSQESLDHEDAIVDISARRSRVRGGRTRCTPGSRVEMTDESRDFDASDDRPFRSAGWPPHRSATGPSGAAGPPLPGHVNFYASAGGDHESPNRMRIKDKRSWQPGYLHKGKPPAPASKDKRKLREKRRSSGLVHAQSAESTGDSLDDVDNDSSMQRSAAHNEIIDADNPQTPEEDRKIFGGRKVRCKSPSDLDADFEDNQDYDSTVSQSETKLPMFIPSSRVDSVQEVESPTSADSLSAVRSAAMADAGELQRYYFSTMLELCRRYDAKQLLAEERNRNRLLRETLDTRERTIVELQAKIQELMKA